MADFDPHQLDQLEDALESLGDGSDLESFELDPELVDRLGEYREVLDLCREAFPLESPSDEVLAGVLAEANEVSRRPRRRGAEADGSAWRQFWERWRGTLIPGFALAGTAAAVLWILEPDQNMDRGTDLLERDDATHESERESGSAPNTEPSEPASDPTPAAKPDAEGPGAGEAEANADEGASEGDTDNQAIGLGGGDATAPKRKKTKKLAPPEPAPAPAAEPLSKDETWTELERANAARRTGNCDRARSIYEDIIAAGSHSLAVARAKAGIGLCFEQDRRSSEANKWFDDARSSVPGIDAWINTQRDEQPLPGENKKRKSKKALDESFEQAL